MGIDLGGTKIEGLVLDENGAELVRQRIDTPVGYEAILEAIRGLVADLEAQVGATASVGLATPGARSPSTGLHKNSNTTSLNGRDFLGDVARTLGRRVAAANDANCLALSEATDGAGRDARVVFGVIVGTGTGGGIVVDGRVLTGPNAIAGEWGHNPLPWPQAEEWPGPPCYCGRTGCIETFLSGPGLARDFETKTGRRATAEAIAVAAASGDPEAVAALDRYAERMARALASVINVLDPDVIVMGGGMSNITSLYRTVPQYWAEWVFSDGVETPLLPAEHGDSSGVRGAAWLAETD